MMEKSCEESRASNPQRDRSSLGGDDIKEEDLSQVESIESESEEGEDEVSKEGTASKKSTLQVMPIPNKRKKSDRRASVAVTHVKGIMNTGSTTEVMKIPIKKSMTMSKQIRKNRRESVLTQNSSKISSRNTD